MLTMVNAQNADYSSNLTLKDFAQSKIASKSTKKVAQSALMDIKSIRKEAALCMILTALPEISMKNVSDATKDSMSILNQDVAQLF
jgi:hypothetical protein